MLSDEWLPRYRLLENFTAKWNGNGNGNGNGNAYDRGDYNSSFALRAVELKRSYHGRGLCLISLHYTSDRVTRFRCANTIIYIQGIPGSIYIYIYIHKIFEGILPYMGVAAILVMRSRCHEKNFVPPIQGGFTYNLALIGPAVTEKKMFEHCERRRWKTTDGRLTMGILQAHL